MSFKTHGVDQMMQAGVDRHIYPGAVLAVARGDDLIYEKAFGRADLFSGRAVRCDTFFDLASLTKPLATVLAVMALVRRGDLALDQLYGQWCPRAVGPGKEQTTLRQLLRHRAGLPGWQPFFMSLRHLAFGQHADALQAMIGRTPLSAPAGERSDYSDLGYMVLQWVVEAVVQTDLARAVRDLVYQPLGIEDLFFNDTRQPVASPERFAATQLCPWRQKLMLGHVDDDNAYVCGGIAGHAGLFGTAAAVVRLLQAMAAADHDLGGSPVFDSQLVKQFWQSDSNERWALGFDTPAQRGSSAGRYFPPESVGHLGFTGTSFWVHRDQRLIVVLLTNRVHPWRFNAGIKAFRPRLHDAVMEAADLA